MSSGLCWFAEPDWVGEATLHAIPNDSLFNRQWHWHNSGQTGGKAGADIDAANAWDVTIIPTQPTKIAVIDYGFYWDGCDHPSLTKYYPLDVVGENCLHPQNDTDPTPGAGCRSSTLRCWHGASVLGIIAAMTDNGTGISGLVPGLEFVAVKMADDRGLPSTTCIVRALDAIRQPGPYRSDLAVCPWAWEFSDSLNSALLNVWDEGIPVFVSAGNSGTVEFPASSPYAIAIGATNDSDHVQVDGRRGGSFVSGIGEALDFVAPGVFIWTWDLSGLDGWIPNFYGCDGQINYNCVFEGTSASVAVAGGVAALIMTKKPEYKSYLGVDSVYSILQHTSEDQLGDFLDEPGRDWYFGHGRVNAYRALLSLMHGDLDNSGSIDATDLALEIDYVFFGGTPPLLYHGLADVAGTNGSPCDGYPDATDVAFLIDYVHFGGQAPPNCYNFF